MGDHNLFIPTEAEKRRSISYILDAGMSRRAPFGQELRAVLEGVGVRGLLFGTGDCLALSLLIWVLCLLPALALTRSTSSLAPALFLFSPLLYAALFLLTGWKNLQAGIWEWTWTFQISARMVAALRRTVRVGMCPCKLGAVAADRAGTSPWLDAVSVPGQPVFIWRSVPVLPADAGGSGTLGGPPLLDFAESGAADPAPYIGLADGSPRRGVLPAGCCWNHPIPRGIAPLLPAPDGRRRFLCSALSM